MARLAAVSALLLLAAAALPAPAAAGNGLAQTPPMGWRSWNAFLLNVDQDLMMSIAHAMAAPVGGKPSLASFGFTNVGIDDGWQNCTNHNFHDKNGNPIVNTTRFPDLKGFSEAVHALGLTSGWYQNNCWCNEVGKPPHYANDANATAYYLFDGVKVDGCGPAHNITLWAQALAATGRPIVLENCGDNHETWSPPLPSELKTCDFNLYRISSDIAPQFYSTMYNLQFQIRYQDEVEPMSRPGCWSYPDMLQVGNLNAVESRTHFSAWAVTSAPLILGFDLTNQTAMDIAYPIISNLDVITVNQQWGGIPGRLVANSSEHFVAKTYHGASASGFTMEVFPNWQIWSKDLPAGKLAVLIINISEQPQSVSISLSKLDFPSQAHCRDLYTHQDSTISNELSVSNLAPHDSYFVILQGV